MDKQAIKKRLLNFRTELTKLDDIASESQSTVTLDQQSVGRLSRMDAMQQQAMAMATKARREASLARIKHALTLLETDEYGYCERCGEEIPAKRLDIDPVATHCVRCISN